ncbi:hypothetical protein [Herbaspirillum huttiense]|uniref:hypothetical protein n=1 Tax=Herbaspirillum huttiense TaxID=863372 RepID=UPI0031DA9D80
MTRAQFLLLVALWTTWVNAPAAQVPVTKMQNALSGVIQAKAVQRGFTPADIRVTNTMYRASTPLLDAVVEATELKNARGIASRLGTWGAIAAVITGAAYALGYYGAMWYYSSDGKVKTGSDPQSVNTPAGMAVPSEIWCWSNVCGSSREAACSYRTKGSGTVQGRTYAITYEPAGNDCHAIWTFADTGQKVDAGSAGSAQLKSGNTTACPGISLSASGGKCPASNFPEPAPAASIEDSAAAESMPAADKASPLPLQPVADIANNAWREAASRPGYDGLPYDATNPITSADVSSWRDANTNYWPTMGDFVTPQQVSYSDPGSGPVTNPITGTTSPAAQTPFGLPTSSTPQSSVDPATSAPNTGTNPSTEPVQNLGPDPGIGAPPLEPIPTALQIISPTMNIFPSLKSFVVPSVDAQCPTWDVPVFGKQIALKDHCPLLEQSRPTLYAAMAVAYALIALFIVLRA